MYGIRSKSSIINPKVVTQYTRRRYRRRRYYKRKPNKIFYRNVKQVINTMAEKKYLPYTNSTSVSTTPVFLQFTGITQGDTDLTRDGDSVYLKSIQVGFSVLVGDSYNQVRFITFQWFPPSTLGTNPPTENDILQDSALGTISVYNHDTRMNYRILDDKTVVVDSDDPNMIYRLIITKIPKRKLQYVGGGTVSPFHIYCLVVSDSTTATHPSIAYSGKTNFIDM